ncbi:MULTISPECIES: Hsp20/alpha crystallin family protein [Bacillus]|jgi:HSP20 family molecular chaperone IbpA|uniref:Hsp20/alpha crystallin family protein n=1 Tax=Bacillus TaxID=1386 RepID=UPI00076151A5|nr:MULTISPECIES: Hsp20/alpha crystallin family protein [Bacillus]AOC56394.1 sporulation protein [Bacillus pumilus]AZV52718.1 Hsp20/alpha crystallin family protein [Bacillus pumilus]MBR0585760.1 Hsp20/alpha crystallin family protein [Bacillus pumilus DW2J2]MBR0615977.1 Hsp20/alpha crystallin family protein [Bacillus pumilus]MBR0619458.1 Hsp20/alpha crystallin family protein [Bacillus pumilus]
MKHEGEKKHELLANEDILNEAIEQFFASSPFHEIINSAEALMTTSHSLASITTDVTEDEQFVYIEIQFPDHFVEGDIALEVKAQYLHLSVQETIKTDTTSSYSSFTKTILMPAKIDETNMKSVWKDQTLRVTAPKQTTQ